MEPTDGPQLRLQRQIDCYLETKPRDALNEWETQNWKEEPGTDSDEAPLKYLGLVLLEAIDERATRVTIDREEGVVVHADESYYLPKAPDEYIARGLELFREMMGMGGGAGEGRLALGVRGESVDLIVQKEAGKHIVTIPGISELSK
jgi:hypothetical protein